MAVDKPRNIPGLVCGIRYETAMHHINSHRHPQIATTHEGTQHNHRDTRIHTETARGVAPRPLQRQRLSANTPPSPSMETEHDPPTKERGKTVIAAPIKRSSTSPIAARRASLWRRPVPCLLSLPLHKPPLQLSLFPSSHFFT